MATRPLCRYWVVWQVSVGSRVGGPEGGEKWKLARGRDEKGTTMSGYCVHRPHKRH